MWFQKMPTPAVGTSTSTLSTPTPAYVPAASSRLPTQPAAATPTTGNTKYQWQPEQNHSLLATKLTMLSGDTVAENEN